VFRTTSLQNGVNDALVNGQCVFRDLFKEGFIAANADITHLLKRGIGIDKVALTDKVCADLLLARDGHRAHRSERLDAVRSSGCRSIEIPCINTTQKKKIS